MKIKIHLWLVATLLAATFSVLSAQNDTLLFENFQTDPTDFFTDIPEGNDTTWVNFDSDGFEDSNNRPQNWYFTEAFRMTRDTLTASGEPNFVLASSSWLMGFLEGNRNWLILKPLQILNNQATLHFKSAPFQAPRYMDGYSVLVSETSNASYEDVFTDTLFRAAQMTEILGTENSIELSDFIFSKGYIHADSLRDTLYAVVTTDTSGSPLITPQMEPHSLSLAAYAGKRIYIAFLHDSDDDNLMALDDILVLGNNNPTNSKDLSDNIRFVTYPNPAMDWINVMYRLEKTAAVGLEMRNTLGQLVGQIYLHEVASGEQQHQLNLSRLPAGTYHLVLTIDHQKIIKKFVKI